MSFVLLSWLWIGGYLLEPEHNPNIGRKQVLLAHQSGDTCSSSPRGGATWVLPHLWQNVDQLSFEGLVQANKAAMGSWVQKPGLIQKTVFYSLPPYHLPFKFFCATSPLWCFVSFAGADIADPMTIFLHQSLVLCLRWWRMTVEDRRRNIYQEVKKSSLQSKGDSEMIFQVTVLGRDFQILGLSHFIPAHV